MQQNFVVIYAIIAVVLSALLFHFGSLSAKCQTNTLSKNVSSQSSANSLLIAETVGSATSGMLFKGNRVAEFPKSNIKFADFKQHTTMSDLAESSNHCLQWSVVTTIFEPSEAVQHQATLLDWCLVVVGDHKGPAEYPLVSHTINNHPNVIFLDEKAQFELGEHFPLVHELPWNHFGRKNVGYLYAVLHGATSIWDFDDDNLLFREMLSIKQNETLDVLTVHSYNSTVFNPYPIMGALYLPSWPRGMPLTEIKSTNSKSATEVVLTFTQVPVSRIGIIQSLADHDPDVDAIYRLVQPLPFHFTGPSSKHHHQINSDDITKFLVVPDKAYTPYNAQATLHFYNSFWSMMLPVTVHGRVSDIWRGYIYQRVARDLGLKLIFSTSLVKQFRNTHNYLADFNSEYDLYFKSERLVEQLDEWILTADSLPGRIEQMYVLMYEHGYMGERDVVLCQIWLQALAKAGYIFPTLLHKSKL